LVAAFVAHGFRSANAWYLNDNANVVYARSAPDGGRLRQPVLFIGGEWDSTCDGVIELPTINRHAQGPAAIEQFIAGLLKRIPDFRFKNIHIFIETPDQSFGEYEVEAMVPSTGKLYKQAYAGRLVAEHGKIKLLREALDTLAASRAFRND
jgi:ketosteroid isomerase-like protein